MSPLPLLSTYPPPSHLLAASHLLPYLSSPFSIFSSSPLHLSFPFHLLAACHLLLYLSSPFPFSVSSSSPSPPPIYCCLIRLLLPYLFSPFPFSFVRFYFISLFLQGYLTPSLFRSPWLLVLASTIISLILVPLPLSRLLSPVSSLLPPTPLPLKSGFRGDAAQHP